MKNFTRLTLLLFISAILIAGTNTFAGKKPFQGIITYKITYPNSNFDATVMSQLPGALNLFIGKDKVKTSMKMSSGAQEQIINLEDHSTTTLIDLMGQKYAVYATKEESEKEAENTETSVEYLDETKEIAGYECKKAVVKVNDKKTGQEYNATVYYTEELETPDTKSLNPVFKDIKGTMLEYEIQVQGMTMKFTAININKKKLSKKEFKIPEGYTETTQEELRSNFGGGM